MESGDSSLSGQAQAGSTDLVFDERTLELEAHPPTHGETEAQGGK